MVDEPLANLEPCLQYLLHGCHQEEQALKEVAGANAGQHEARIQILRAQLFDHHHDGAGLMRLHQTHKGQSPFQFVV